MTDSTTAPGENVLRQARLAKSPAELKLMRYASTANVAAAMASAGRARELGTSRRLRADFYAEAARRGNLGHFMVVAGSSSEALDQPLTDGTAVSIDCVSTCRFYHGDFARTIFVGEPPVQVRRAIEAIQVAWHEIREQLRPGMRFADVPRIGREALKKQGADIPVSFTPHSVGLFHTDHPQPSLIAPRVADDLRLETNMVLSVDCPVFMAGLGGTIHYEDLMLIGPGPAEPIHTVHRQTNITKRPDGKEERIETTARWDGDRLGFANPRIDGWFGPLDGDTTGLASVLQMTFKGTTIRSRSTSIWPSCLA